MDSKCVLQNISRFLPMERRFSLDDLFEQVHQRGYKLGLVIDLTNTTRYYNAMVCCCHLLFG